MVGDLNFRVTRRRYKSLEDSLGAPEQADDKGRSNADLTQILHRKGRSNQSYARMNKHRVINLGPHSSRLTYSRSSGCVL
eukprot:6551878-Pyramimonas_sp.AAC.1